MRNHKLVPDGALVRTKEWGSIGTVVMSSGDGEPTTTYLVRSAMDGDMWLFRDQFTPVKKERAA